MLASPELLSGFVSGHFSVHTVKPDKLCASNTAVRQAQGGHPRHPTRKTSEGRKGGRCQVWQVAFTSCSGSRRVLFVLCFALHTHGGQQLHPTAPESDLGRLLSLQFCLTLGPDAETTHAVVSLQLSPGTKAGRQPGGSPHYCPGAGPGSWMGRRMHRQPVGWIGSTGHKAAS